MSTESYEKSFTVSENPIIEVGHIRGKIHIFPGEDGIVHVTAVKHLNTGSPERTQVIIEQNEAGDVIIQAKYDKGLTGFMSFLREPCKIDFTITVPKTCQLSVKTVSGEAELQGLAGKTHVGSVSGALVANDMSGLLSLDTVSGKIEGRQLSGPLTLKSVSGRVTLSDSNFPSLTAKTVSGSLTLETPLGEGPYQVGSVSGSLTLIVPEGTNCTASISSVSGSVHTNLPDAQRWKTSEPGHRHQRVTIGQGGPEISLIIYIY